MFDTRARLAGKAYRLALVERKLGPFYRSIRTDRPPAKRFYEDLADHAEMMATFLEKLAEQMLKDERRGR